MPWCDTCSKFWNPTSMNADGSCPACGRVLDAGTTRLTGDTIDVRKLAAGGGASDGSPDDDDVARAPWHFKLMVVLVAAYLLWRLYQLIAGIWS